MSKVLLMGAAGTEGKTLAEDLLKHDTAELVLADYNFEGVETRAKQLAEKYNKTVNAQFIDANDYAGMVELMKDVDPDVIVSVIGPYFKYGVTIPKASIEAGYSYVDINDDYLPSQEVLDTLNDSAKEKGLSIIIGCGATPGVSNMIGKLVYEELDLTNSINMDWLWPSDEDASGAAALEHGFEILTGEHIQYLDGEYRTIESATEIEAITSSNNKFEGNVAYVGHGEPATMPRYLDGVDEITNKGGLLPKEMTAFLIHLAGVGLADDSPVRINDTDYNPGEVVAALLERAMKDSDIEAVENRDHGYLRVKVAGEKDRKEIEKTFEYYGAGSEMTSYPTSIVAQMIASGKITVTGAHTPEVFDAGIIEEIFDGLKVRGLALKEL